MSENTEGKVPEPKQEMSFSERRATLKAQMAELDRVERTTGRTGAVPNTSKQRMLDYGKEQAQHPNKRLRWLTLANKDKMESRKANGYEVLPVAEGGRQVGNLVLGAISREEYERRVADMEKRDRELLSVHNRDIDAEAEAVAKFLRDKIGVDIRAEDIIIKG
jgi:hypothetical protein